MYHILRKVRCNQKKIFVESIRFIKFIFIKTFLNEITKKRLIQDTYFFFVFFKKKPENMENQTTIRTPFEISNEHSLSTRGYLKNILRR